MKRNPPYAQDLAFTGSIQALFELLSLNYTKARYRFERAGRETDLRMETYAAALVWQQARGLLPPARYAGLRERLIIAARDQAALLGFWLHGDEQDIATLSAAYHEHMRWLCIALEPAALAAPRVARQLDLLEEAVCSR